MSGTGRSGLGSDSLVHSCLGQLRFRFEFPVSPFGGQYADCCWQSHHLRGRVPLPSLLPAKGGCRDGLLTGGSGLILMGCGAPLAFQARFIAQTLARRAGAMTTVQRLLMVVRWTRLAVCRPAGRVTANLEQMAKISQIVIVAAWKNPQQAWGKSAADSWFEPYGNDQYQLAAWDWAQAPQGFP